MLNKKRVYRMDLTGSGLGPVSSFCEHSVRPSGSRKIWGISSLTENPSV